MRGSASSGDKLPEKPCNHLRENRQSQRTRVPEIWRMTMPETRNARLNNFLYAAALSAALVLVPASPLWGQ